MVTPDRSRQGVRILYTFLVPILVPIPVKCLITLEIARIGVEFLGFRCRYSLHFCRLETLSEDRRSFKRLILNENAKTGTEIAVLLGEG